ncbi:hypothetical protein PR202_ga03631 [Eleusine coracana subsp. coracana]|uniref:Uncharacterized protein n=1 Tax=Eleusine coracana subsp. coracana TaxID=191504 RepID=A0AAV5BQW8_ELECO|nr:hypothetical protein PR202_ga03631 [Eleusine coracana subsp. coracana]
MAKTHVLLAFAVLLGVGLCSAARVALHSAKGVCGNCNGGDNDGRDGGSVGSGYGSGYGSGTGQGDGRDTFVGGYGKEEEAVEVVGKVN